MRLCWKWLMLVLVVGAGSVIAQDEPFPNEVYAISADGTRIITTELNDEGKSIGSLIDVGGGSRSIDQVIGGER